LRVLGLDPGAARMGFACLAPGDEAENKVPIYLGSGFLGLERQSNGKKQEPYQEYKLRLIHHWVEKSNHLLDMFEPDEVVSEIVPVVGGGNFVVATQSQLAATAITTFQAVAVQRKVPIRQVGATTVKARIGGKKDATKVGVRNGVIQLIPELAERKSNWTKVFEEPDALAITLTHMGFRIG
jgi:Holliday junction resolvasome RuvABC endonuclease subunit